MKVWVDANPQEIAYVTDTEVTRIEVLPRKYLTSWTNNEAEYKAIIMALKDLKNITEILSDAQPVIRQLKHEYAIKADHLRPLALEVWKLAKGNVKFTWIPRNENKAGKLLG